MLDSEDEWNEMFADLAQQRADDEREARRRRVPVAGTPERLRQRALRGREIETRERLRQQAIRLCRRAGIKGVGKDAFTDRTTNQLRSIIAEASAVLDSRIGGL